MMLIITISILTAFCGTAPNNSEIIVGEWVLEDMEFEMSGGIDSDMKAFFDNMKKQVVGKLSFEFKADKTFITVTPVFGKTKTEAGAWAISDDGKILSTTSNKEKKDLTIISLDDDKLVLSDQDEKGSNIMTFKRAD